MNQGGKQWPHDDNGSGSEVQNQETEFLWRQFWSSGCNLETQIKLQNHSTFCNWNVANSVCNTKLALHGMKSVPCNIIILFYWRLYSGMLRGIVTWKLTDVSDVLTASINISVYFYETTRRSILGDSRLHPRCRDNLTSHKIILFGVTCTGASKTSIADAVTSCG
jgi:hypothetical protein